MTNRVLFFFFSSRRRHTRFDCDWSSDVCSSDLWQRRRQSYRELCPQWCHGPTELDRKSTRLNSSHSQISYAVFCLKKKNELYETGQLDLPHASEVPSHRGHLLSPVTVHSSTLSL